MREPKRAQKSSPVALSSGVSSTSTSVIENPASSGPLPSPTSRQPRTPKQPDAERERELSSRSGLSGASESWPPTPNSQMKSIKIESTEMLPPTPTTVDGTLSAPPSVSMQSPLPLSSSAG